MASANIFARSVVDTTSMVCSPSPQISKGSPRHARVANVGTNFCGCPGPHFCPMPYTLNAHTVDTGSPYARCHAVAKLSAHCFVML
jgi:hypothetical protein